MRLPAAVAELLLVLAREEAAAAGVPMTLAVCDEAGLLQAFLRMDGALAASVEVAPHKAYTAAFLRLPSHEVGALAQPGGLLYGIQHTHGGRIILLPGGLPLTRGGRVVGGIGASGGSGEEDLRVAGAAVRGLLIMERLAAELASLAGGERDRRALAAGLAGGGGAAAPAEGAGLARLVRGAALLMAETI